MRIYFITFPGKDGEQFVAKGHELGENPITTIDFDNAKKTPYLHVVKIWKSLLEKEKIEGSKIRYIQVKDYEKPIEKGGKNV